MFTYPFTEEQFRAAVEEWNCNCGPSALAFALQIGLDKVRHAIPGFAEKHYTSPTMMKAALRNLDRGFASYPAGVDQMFRVTHQPSIALVRIQWTGPWTKAGANPKWAYRQTHWIACYSPDKVFDCNGGIRSFESWKADIAPLLASSINRADGGWFPTHVWMIAHEKPRRLPRSPLAMMIDKACGIKEDDYV